MLYNDCVLCSSRDDIKAADVINRINEPNRSFLLFLFGFLKDISDFSDVNDMTARNIAIVFAPCLFSYSSSIVDDTNNPEIQMIQQETMNRRLKEYIQFLVKLINGVDYLQPPYRFNK